MIDLHTHVLPGLDDGPDDFDGSADILDAAEADGTQILCATPHLREDFPLVKASELKERCAELRRRLRPALAVIPGAEVGLTKALSASEEELGLASLGQMGKVVLIETPYGQLPGRFDELLFQIVVRGFRVLLAHPERNPTFQQEPGRIGELVRRGVLIQVNAPSILAPQPKSRSRRLALELLKEGVPHVIASDSHSGGPVRPPGLRDAVRAAEAVCGPRAEWMVTDAPAAILAGSDPPPPPAFDPPRPRRFGRR